jgi:hypothetical protein
VKTDINRRTPPSWVGRFATRENQSAYSYPSPTHRVSSSSIEPAPHRINLCPQGSLREGFRTPSCAARARVPQSGVRNPLAKLTVAESAAVAERGPIARSKQPVRGRSLDGLLISALGPPRDRDSRLLISRPARSAPLSPEADQRRGRTISEHSDPDIVAAAGHNIGRWAECLFRHAIRAVEANRDRLHVYVASCFKV